MKPRILLPFLLFLLGFSRCLTDSDPDLIFDDLQSSQHVDSNSIDPLSVPISERHKKGTGHSFRTSPLLDDDDDEDLALGYNSGNGPDFHEGSGTPDPNTVTDPVSISPIPPVVTSRPPYITTITPPVSESGKALYFRVTMTFLAVPYEPALSDRNSPAFMRRSEDVVRSIQPLFERIHGQQIIQPISFSPTPSRRLLVTFDIGSKNNNNETEIREVVERMVQSGLVGRHRVSRDDFTFKRYGTSTVKDCEDNEFYCGPDECIDARRVCDRRRDCRDGSDERNCPEIERHICRPDQFACATQGECIDERRRCDNRRDCRDGSDETNCTRRCQDDEFQCTSGECIKFFQRCDFNNDCPQGEDEAFCPRATPPPTTSHCPPNYFQCSDRLQCIPQERKCNGRSDCSDGSDERSCRCLPTQFTCENSICIDLHRKCDGFHDCQDKSDEKDCPRNCGPDQFRCRNGQCIPKSLECNRRDDCRDNSDEIDCRSKVCRIDQFRCSNGTCLNIAKRCDNIVDCPGGADEIGCGKCMKDQFQCRDGSCISERQKCDRRMDCRDGSDEAGCQPECKRGDIVCRNGTCLDSSKRCDGVKDCPYGIDEDNCPPVPRPCRGSEIRCGDGICLDSSKRCDGTPDCRDSSDEVGCETCTDEQFQCDNLLCIPKAHRCNLRYECPDGSDERDCPRRRCSSGEFQCNDGDCIESVRHCDRNNDCRDGSDEFNCGCQPNQYQCSSGECVDISFKCDGKPDCRDRSDEISCRNCAPHQYYCANGECIDRNRRCDGKFDCSDFSDESDCTPEEGGVNIRVYPERQKIRQGREVVFRCRDEGPRRSAVKWSRADNRAMPVSTREFRGRLTMPNIQPEHSGVYICAATAVNSGVTGAQKAAFLDVQPCKYNDYCDLLKLWGIKRNRRK